MPYSSAKGKMLSSKELWEVPPGLRSFYRLLEEKTEDFETKEEEEEFIPCYLPSPPRWSEEVEWSPLLPVQEEEREELFTIWYWIWLLLGVVLVATLCLILLVY